MSFRRVFLAVLPVLFVCSASLVRAQSTDLPTAPAPKPTQSIFTLPAATAHTVLQSAPETPPPPAPVEDQICDAPATGIYAPQHHKPFSPELQRELEGYKTLVNEQVRQEFYRHIPRSANDPWLQGKFTKVRFAVMPDGSYDPAIVTATSGRKGWDAHALESINSYDSFPLPPKGITHPVLFCINFIYQTSEYPSSVTPPLKPIDLWPPPAKPAK